MVTEKRYIEANAAMEELSTLYVMVTGLRAGKGVLKKYMEHFRESVLRIIDEQPTVDAVEVVHGRWEDMFGGEYANPRYRCSACKEKALYNFKKNGLDQWEEVQALTPYCPNCGAKMDGDGNG